MELPFSAIVSPYLALGFPGTAVLCGATAVLRAERDGGATDLAVVQIGDVLLRMQGRSA